MSKHDVLIIGGGHNGLVAACYLAKAGKKVLVLEANSEIGGASTSEYVFAGLEAKLSRYSYLVSLLPDQIIKELGLNFECISRKISSYTPYEKSGNDAGLLVKRVWDETNDQSFNQLTGSDIEGQAWQRFYDQVSQFAQVIAHITKSGNIVEVAGNCPLPSSFAVKGYCRSVCFIADSLKKVKCRTISRQYQRFR
jgi:phytoene dehydrogenase-like protein